MTCPFGTMDWYCCLAAGHDGPHESHELPPDTSTNPPSVPPLDVEACAGLLAELANNPDFYHLHPRAVASLDNLRHFLLEALPGMGKKADLYDWIREHAQSGMVPHPTRGAVMLWSFKLPIIPTGDWLRGGIEAEQASGDSIIAEEQRNAAARAAQPEETSADAT